MLARLRAIFPQAQAERRHAWVAEASSILPQAAEAKDAQHALCRRTSAASTKRPSW